MFDLKATVSAGAALLLLGSAGAAAAACKVRHFTPDQDAVTVRLDPTVFEKNPKALGPHTAYSGATGGPSRIGRIVNLSDCQVTIRTVDGRGGTGRLILPGATAASDVLIPVAETEAAFADHHLVINFEGRDVFWVWSKGDWLWYALSPGGYAFRHNRPPGTAQAGGTRLLAVALDRESRPTLYFRMIEPRR
jgi:hypothetical protein